MTAIVSVRYKDGYLVCGDRLCIFANDQAVVTEVDDSFTKLYQINPSVVMGLAGSGEIDQYTVLAHKLKQYLVDMSITDFPTILKEVKRIQADLNSRGSEVELIVVGFGKYGSNKLRSKMFKIDSTGNHIELKKFCAGIGIEQAINSGISEIESSNQRTLGQDLREARHEIEYIFNECRKLESLDMRDNSPKVGTAHIGGRLQLLDVTKNGINVIDNAITYSVLVKSGDVLF